MLLHAGTQTAGNPIYEDLNFKNFPGEDTHTPQYDNSSSGSYLKTPVLKFCILPE